MNKYNKLTAMSLDELAEWLDSNFGYGDSPWCMWFEENYCSKCKPTIAQNKGRVQECAACESGVDRCGFSECETVEIIKVWLNAMED